MVDKFRAVVRVSGNENKRHGLANFVQGCCHTAFALAEYGTALDPLGEDVGDVERVSMFSGSRKSAVRDQINFDEAGSLDIPEFSADGDLMAQQQAWFCGAVDFFP